MKSLKSIANILFVATLLSPILSFGLANIIGESDILGIGGTVRYSWVMWLFIPIGVLSLFVGKKLKQQNNKYKKNYIITFICVPLLILFGSYGIIFGDMFDYSPETVISMGEDLGFDIPKEIKASTAEETGVVVARAKIEDTEEKKHFENAIASNPLWVTNINALLFNTLPHHIQYDVYNYDYFVFINKTTGDYNTVPYLSGTFECAVIAYDIDTGAIIIAGGYTVSV